jgi:hypothetical protein
MDFELISSLTGIEPIAVGRGIRDRRRLLKAYGKGRWRKLRGIATVRLLDGTIHTQRSIGTRPMGLDERSSN